MSAVVRGATTSVMPDAEEQRRRKDVDERGCRRPPGGGIARRRPSTACWSAGIRASHSWPAAISRGPTTRNGQTPTRPATVPTRVEPNVRIEPGGQRPDQGRRERGVPEDPLEEDRLEELGRVERAVDEERRDVDDRELAAPEQLRAARAGPRRTTMSTGNSSAATMPTPSATRLAGSLQPVSWPRTMPNASPPTAIAMTIEPSQSRRRGASGSRDSGT